MVNGLQPYVDVQYFQNCSEAPVENWEKSGTTKGHTHTHTHTHTSPPPQRPFRTENKKYIYTVNTFVQVAVMQRVPSDQVKNLPVPIWDTYQQIVDAAEGKPVSMHGGDGGCVTFFISRVCFSVGLSSPSFLIMVKQGVFCCVAH